MATDSPNTNICSGCGLPFLVGYWPFPCSGNPEEHIMYTRMAINSKGTTPDYAPPQPINPMKEAVMTRDWISADGKVRPMPPDEWARRDAIFNTVGPNAKLPANIKKIM